ncbi:MAG TPA: hypothetical protein VFU86_08055 [Terriglobales bacterium]|nr:hypothetical protein [Terriglobales bacterium]
MTLRTIALFLVATTLPMFAQSEPPTANLSCWANPTTFRSAKARSETFHSEKAGDAYAETSATATTAPDNVQICSNTVRLFYASDTKDYKVVVQDHRTSSGLGIAILGWSKAGTELLFQINGWPYERDAYVERRAFLFESSSQRIRPVPVVVAFRKLFGSNCEFDERVLGWHGENALVVRISKTPLNESYDQKFCEEKPTDYVFDLKTYGISKVQ